MKMIHTKSGSHKVHCTQNDAFLLSIHMLSLKRKKVQPKLVGSECAEVQRIKRS